MAIQDILKKKTWRAYQEVFNLDDPHVKAVMKDLCAAHHIFDACFDPDPIELARMAGERNAIIRIFTILKSTPEDILDLVKEDNDEIFPE